MLSSSNNNSSLNALLARLTSPDECRDSLVKDENSGYNNLTGEAPEEDFGKYSGEGGSETPQGPFSLDEWKESDHPRDKDGKFSTSNSGGGSSKPDSTNEKADKTQIAAPKTIAGVKRGKPMSFKQANEGKVNPNYSKGKGYQTNCQACIAIFEARMRGFDIQAAADDGHTNQELHYKPFLAYKDPTTGQTPQFIKSNVKNGKECKQWLNEQIKRGERYAFAYSPEMTINPRGHIIEIIKEENGKLTFYDPQKGIIYDERFLEDIGYETNIGTTQICYSPMIFRVDDKELDYDILNEISQTDNQITEK